MKRTPYQCQSSGQVERNMITVVAHLRQYFDEHENKLDIFVQPLTYAYNTEAHISTGIFPFSFVMARNPPEPKTFDFPSAIFLD